MRRGQLDAMIRYVHDNPRRAIVRRLRPDYMQRSLCLTIAGVRYSAFGNFMLLRRPCKEQVFCHRQARYGQLTDEERQRLGLPTLAELKAPPTSTLLEMKTTLPYHQTAAYAAESEALLSEARELTVLVTPGISPGERDIKNRALTERLPLIHLQKEPIRPHWKPERQRFDACCDGSLLILAPWPADLDAMPSRLAHMGEVDASTPAANRMNNTSAANRMNNTPATNGMNNTPAANRMNTTPAHPSRPPVSDYDRFHNMNDLARQLCDMDVSTAELKWRVMEEG